MNPSFVSFERSENNDTWSIELKCQPRGGSLQLTGDLKKGRPLWKQEKYRAMNGRLFSTFSINSTRAGWQRWKSLVRKLALKKKRVTYRLKASRWHRVAASMKQSLSVW